MARAPRPCARWLALALTALAGCGAARHLGGGVGVRRDDGNPETNQLTWVSAIAEGAARWRGAVGVHGALGLTLVSGAETDGSAIEALTGPTAQLCRRGTCLEARGAIGAGISDYGYGPDSTARAMVIGEALAGARLRVRARDDLGLRVLVGQRWKWIDDDGRGTRGMVVLVTLDRRWR
jgi:hypothetical protein